EERRVKRRRQPRARPPLSSTLHSSLFTPHSRIRRDPMRRTILGCAVLLCGMVGCKWICPCRCGGEPRCAIGRTQMGPRPGEDQYVRAGCPRDVSSCAHPSDTGAYVAYEVGGGEACPSKGRAPGPDEGVWGWDYCGRCIPSNVELLWTAGRYQGGFDGY